MTSKTLPILDVRSRRHWRSWLQANHSGISEIWLVFHKRHTGIECLGYEEAVEEALCFGWVDSLIRKLDEDRYARKFTPRKADSAWSAINRRRYEKVRTEGLLTPPGLARAPTDRSNAAPPALPAGLPSYIEDALKANARAWENFEKLAPSHRKAYIGWIDFAKREETRRKRLAEAVSLLATGQKLGLK